MKPARLHALIALSALLLAAWALRAPFLAREIWGLDEGSTFTMAQQVHEGAVLYRDAVDNRSPMMPYLKAVVFAVAGDWNIRAEHIALALALGVGAFGLLSLATRLGDRRCGYWSAGAFTLLVFLLPGVIDSLGAHTETFVVLFSILGFWLFVRALPRGGFVAGLGVGLAFACSSLCKQPGALDFGVTWVLLELLAWRQPADRRRFNALFAGSVVAFAAAWAATCIYFWAHGAWDDFVYYAWTFNTRIYVPEVPLLQRLAMVRLTWDLALAWVPAALIVGIPAVALGVREIYRGLVVRDRPVPVLPLLFLGWLTSGLISTALSGRIFPHYVIQVVPGLSLACGWLLARLHRWLRDVPQRLNMRVVTGWMILGAILVSAGFDVRKLWHRLERNDDAGGAALRAVVQRETGKRERIFVWGYYPEAYAICRRLPATRFLYTNYLTGMIPWTNLAPEIDTRYAVKPDAWAAFWRDYNATPPRLIIDAPMRGYTKYPLLSQPGLRDEVVDHFAEIRPAVTEPLQVRIFKRLSSPDTALMLAKPVVDERVVLTAARESAQADLVLLTVTAPIGTTDIALRLGSHPYRQLRCRPDQPTEARFLLRIADLAAHGTVVDAVVRRDGQLVAAKPLDVARRLVLDLRPQQPRPVLNYSTVQLAPTENSDTAGWHRAIRENREGWQHEGPFTLTFQRPTAMHVLTFSWLPPATAVSPSDSDETAEIEVHFDSTLVGPARLPVRTAVGPAGLQEVSVELPRGDPGKITLRSGLRGTVWLGQMRGHAQGPALRFGAREILPALAVQNDEQRLTVDPDGRWNTHAFARILYPREPGMEAVVIEYGIRENAYSAPLTGRSANVILEINFLHEGGQRENLLTRGLDPVNRPDDRGPQTSQFTLPSQGTGEIEIRFVPLQPGNVNDQAYIRRLRAQGAGPDLVISADRVLVPVESQTSGDYRIHVKSANGWVAHAPGMVAYECPGDLRAITFGFGLEESSYWDEHHQPRTDGIDAIVELIEPNGTVTQLFKRSLDPFNVAADRGVQRARVELPGRPSRLVIRLTPGRYSSPSFDWSYLTDIVGETKS